MHFLYNLYKRKKLCLAFNFLIILSLLFVGCKKNQVDNMVNKGGELKVVMPWGKLVFNLNPFMTPPNRLAIVSEIYECLIYINNTSSASKEYPLLATSYKWTGNNHNLVFNLRRGVQWNDGSLFTSKDIVFTFNYIKEHKVLDQYGIWDQNEGLQTVEADGRFKVIFKYSFVNKPHFDTLSKVLIIPKHVWKKIEKPLTYTNENPIGTGPFLYKNFSHKDNIIYGEKNPNYWNETKPYVDSIEIHSMRDNNQCLVSMLKGDMDWSFACISNIEEKWVSKNKKNNKYWSPSVNTVIWYLNTKKPPLDNSGFRKAFGMAVNKELMAKNVYNEEETAHPTGIPENQQDKWISGELNDKVYVYNPKKAQDLLEEIGYIKKDNILMNTDGKRIRNFKILVGSGWTDYIKLAKIIIENLKELGITATIDQQPWDIYFSSLQTGTYDTGICWGQGYGPNPYYIYVKNLSSIKERGNTNFSRYINNNIINSLDNYQKNTDPIILKKSIDTIITCVLENVPYIPLTNATSHHIFNETRFIGWPSDLNPYADGAPDHQGGAIILSSVYLK